MSGIIALVILTNKSIAESSNVRKKISFHIPEIRFAETTTRIFFSISDIDFGWV